MVVAAAGGGDLWPYMGNGHRWSLCQLAEETEKERSQEPPRKTGYSHAVDFGRVSGSKTRAAGGTEADGSEDGR